MTRIIWKRRVGQFQSGLNGYLGAVRICSISPSITRGTKLEIFLPGPKSDGAMASGEETELKSMAEEFLENWLKAAGLV